MKEKAARLIAFYLPQFHPTPENDEWWGKGFTEWTNVAKAKPLFKNHYQPHFPADLGYYDLRVPETREAQARLAADYGIEGFCYWHYWFAGKRILEMPLNEVLKSGKPDFPFCLAWANETWSGIWHGNPGKILIEQTYPGKEDYINHFYEILPVLKDHRYLSINNKKIFIVYRPQKLPDPLFFTQLWRELAAKEGLPGIYFLCVAENWNAAQHGFDGAIPNSPTPVTAKIPSSLINKGMRRIFNTDISQLKKKYFKIPRTYEYRDFVKYSPDNKLDRNQYPVLLPGWDNTPRSASNGLVLNNSEPELFRVLIQKCLKQVEGRPAEEKIIFVKSWNEWAEGNYLEPDRKFGREFLEVVKKEILNN